MWDGRIGTLLQSFSVHTADVVSLAASVPEAEDGDDDAGFVRVFAGSADGQVTAIRRIPSNTKVRGDGNSCKAPLLPPRTLCC